MNKIVVEWDISNEDSATQNTQETTVDVEDISFCGTGNVREVSLNISRRKQITEAKIRAVWPSSDEEVSFQLHQNNFSTSLKSDRGNEFRHISILSRYLAEGAGEKLRQKLIASLFFSNSAIRGSLLQFVMVL